MKKDWQALHDMLNASRFCYDKETNCVSADTAVWGSYLEKHKKAGNWKNKKLPHYDELCVIFGKNRAQGKKVKTVVKMEVEEHQKMGILMKLAITLLPIQFFKLKKLQAFVIRRGNERGKILWFRVSVMRLFCLLLA
ncbi:hypothetical protein HanIR_Chr17g0862941 [Helianthus annuus]|nr:hypothetical protein HanIR_Chr17g0862941 [Helianthus annuus]